MMNEQYTPSYRITPGILHSIEQIGEALGNLRVASDSAVVPILRRGNRIKTVQASLAIEGNSLSLEQITAVLAGKRVLALPREIQEVRNAFAAYEKLSDWSAHSRADLLAAHGLLMAGLVDETGRFRSGGVGIQRDAEVVHVAPPAERVPALMDDLLAWLEKTDEHPLVVSCVFHYEFEFIHPFEDGNGRLGRLWQTLILSHWRPIFALLPVESIIRDSQRRLLSRETRRQEVGNCFSSHLLPRIAVGSNALDRRSVSGAFQGGRVEDSTAADKLTVSSAHGQLIRTIMPPSTGLTTPLMPLHSSSSCLPLFYKPSKSQPSRAIKKATIKATK